MTVPVVVTGATGFVAATLIPVLMRHGHAVRAVTRGTDRAVPAGAMRMVVPDPGSSAMLRDAMAGASAIVHLAARVHVMQETATDALAAYRAANVDATLACARQAAELGVPRFVYLSSVKVFGEQGHFAEDDAPHPSDPYGVSKQEAEERLRALGRDSGMDVVIVRPPLVYGPGVRANFAALQRLVARGVPLPLGAVRNRRSYVAVDNLADAIRAMLEFRGRIDQTFTITDGHDVSTPELIRAMANAMQRPARLVPVPPRLVLAAATLVGRQALVHRLIGSLSFDSNRARTLLGWTPPHTMDDVLRRMHAASAR
ncbi:MAG: NAD-dependent epimerase/dehydratase family protein [Gemmatimonadota bacterium]